MRRRPWSRPETAAPPGVPARRVRPDQIDRLAAQGRDVAAVHTPVDELIRLVNATRVWKHWPKPVLIVVSRDAPEHYTYLREAFRGAPWASVVTERRGEARGPVTLTAERARPWAIVHADRIEADARPGGAARERHDVLGAVPRLLRWTWNTGWKLGQYAAHHTLALGRG